MSLPGSSGGLGNYHADVLGAVPDGADAIGRLTEEIKQRAAGSIKQGNYPEAITLYSKAIEVQQQQGSESVVAVLRANRSMCHLKMGNNQLAHEDAEAAIAKDAAYIKGYYRNGMALVALKKLNQARDTFAAGLALKPEDREIREQLEKLSGMEATTPAQAPAQAQAPAPTAAPASGRGVEAASSKSADGASASTSASAADKDEGEIDGVFRGYKKTSDGRTTTFFNRELDAATKKLIGDIAPKRLDAEVSAVPITSTAGGSAWNTAGTFESVNWTRWATDRLKELLLSVAVTPDACAVTVTEAKLEGDAEIVSNRGKVKRIYDFSLTLKWSLGAEASVATGVMEVRDVTADEDYEVGDCKADDGTSPALQELFRKHVKSSSGALQKAVFAALHTFAEEFKSKV